MALHLIIAKNTPHDSLVSLSGTLKSIDSIISKELRDKLTNTLQELARQGITDVYYLRERRVLIKLATGEHISIDTDHPEYYPKFPGLIHDLSVISSLDKHLIHYDV